jgi:hypothetical protein
MATPTFQSTFAQFVEDLEGTYPELGPAIAACKALPEEELLKKYRDLYKGKAMLVAMREQTLFTAGHEVLPGVVITAKLWKEVSKMTQTAMWNYMSSLILLSAADDTEGDGFWEDAEFKKSMEDMMKNLKDAAGIPMGAAGGAGDTGDANPFAAMGGIFEKLKGMAGMFEGMGNMGGKGMPEFKIPERLYKGHIAKMARELAEEFKPEEFGISPEMLETQDPGKVFEYLQEVFTKNPERLMSAAQRIAKKLQTKFLRGEIKRDEIIAEIEELMKEFSENEAFSAIFGNLGELLSSTAKSTGNEGSERRRVVQERLRRKAAEKEARKAALALPDAAAVAAAEAAAAALLAEDDKKKKSKK